jgi:hypothetical protein
LTYSPHRSDIWLLFAALAYRFNWTGADGCGPLVILLYRVTRECFDPVAAIFSCSHPHSNTELQEMVQHDNAKLDNALLKEIAGKKW